MTAFINTHGRKLDDLDILKIQVSAQQRIQPGQGYVVYSIDGISITGFVPSTKTQAPLILTAAEWRIEK